MWWFKKPIVNTTPTPAAPIDAIAKTASDPVAIRSDGGSDLVATRNCRGEIVYGEEAQRIKDIERLKKRQKELKKDLASVDRPFYNLRPILGCANWAVYYILLGGRQAGKSYAITDLFVHQFVKKGIPFYWLRLSDEEAKKLLTNNAERLIDPDLRRKYNLDLTTNSNEVFAVTKRSKPDKNGKTRILEKKLIARVYSLATFYKEKGSLFDKDFLNDPNMHYNIALDEFQFEKNQRRTFDVVYALANQLENILRNTKDRVKVFFLGNTLEEASDILAAFDFIPEQFGRYKLKKKRCVIDYIEPTDAYKAMRQGNLAEILLPNASTFTNRIDTDHALICKNVKLVKPMFIVKFTKDKDDWFTIWNGWIVAKYNKEKGVKVLSMRPYLDEAYNAQAVNELMAMFDTRSLRFRNLITFKLFQTRLQELKPRSPATK